MKKIISILLLSGTIFSLSSMAQDNNETSMNLENKAIYLSQCNNFGTGVSYFYQSCVNSNFSTISRTIGGYLSNCMNMGQEVDYFFTSCVNNNFSSIQRNLGNSIWLSNCMNFDRKTLDYSFISCVNSNFRTIERELSNKANE